MSNPNDFVIENGVLLKYTGKEDDVIIPSGVCEIGASAFEGCNKIKSVIVPEGVKVIGDHAFNKCTQLQSVSLPTSLEFVCNAAFNVCRELRNLQFPKNTRFEMMDNVTSDCWYLDCLIFPESAQYDARYEVEPFQLYGCNHIACLVCPDFPIEEIVSKQRVAAIQGYIRFTDHYHKSDVIASYNAYLFKQGKKLLPIVWEFDSVPILQIYSENGKITKKNVDADYLQPALAAKATECVKFLMEWKNQNVSADENERNINRAMKAEFEKDPYNATDMKKLWSYQKLEDGTIEITSYKGCETMVEVPPRIGKLPVTSIGKCAFSPYKDDLLVYSKPYERSQALSNIRTVVIPEGISTIKEAAFGGCECLEKIEFPKSITTIMNSAFSKCKSLRSIQIPEQVKKLSNNVLSHCSHLASVSLPSGLTEIGYMAFSGCPKMKDYFLPESVVLIGKGAMGCSAYSMKRDLEITIHGKHGSYAETYAEENGIPFVAE